MTFIVDPTETALSALAQQSGCCAISLEEFLGAGLTMPSDAFSVADEEAREILDILEHMDWAFPVWEEGVFSVRLAMHSENSTIGLFCRDNLVGFYEGSCLWIAGAHRGQRLSTPIILAAALDRGGSALPPGVPMHGYSPAGLQAHRRAWEIAQQAAAPANQNRSNSARQRRRSL